MELEDAQALVELINNEGEHSAKVIEKYSGRGMFGRETAAVSTDANLIKFGYYCGLAQFAAEAVGRIHYDSLGYNQVYY